MASRDNRPPWPETLNQSGRHFVWESDLQYYQVQLVAYSLGKDAPAKPPQPDNDRLVPIAQAAERFGLSRRTVGRMIRGRRSAPPPVPQIAAAE